VHANGGGSLADSVKSNPVISKYFAVGAPFSRSSPTLAPRCIAAAAPAVNATTPMALVQLPALTASLTRIMAVPARPCCHPLPWPPAPAAPRFLSPPPLLPPASSHPRPCCPPLPLDLAFAPPCCPPLPRNYTSLPLLPPASSQLRPCCPSLPSQVGNDEAEEAEQAAAAGQEGGTEGEQLGGLSAAELARILWDQVRGQLPPACPPAPALPDRALYAA
jgi:hypothetical protein